MTHESLSDSPSPQILSTIAELRECCADMRRRGRRIGLVPTMGALHEGHLSLARAANAECDATFVTIFVNPTQFGPHEDFGRYPRTLERDRELLAQERVAWVFVPSTEQLYPPGCSTWVEPSRVSLPWEGVCRPGHFRGVATIVLKLFQLIPADVAFFGQKDFQQCRVIETMVRDLNIPITIRRCPTVREPDGLAMSSRNRYLSAEERERALALSRALRAGKQLIEGGECDARFIQDRMREVLLAAGIDQIDYVGIADPETMEALDEVGARAVLLIAARVGQTRLIDNCLLE